MFREGKGGRKKGRETSMYGSSCVPPTGDLAHDPGMCPDWESNQWPFGSQSQPQSTETHQSGNLENVMLSEISQWEKDKYHMISLICEI